MSRYQALLFDFDGTLCPSLSLWAKAFLSTLNRYEISASEDEIIKRCFFRTYAEIVEDFGLPCKDEFASHMTEGLTLAFAAADLFPLVLHVLEECTRAGYKLALVTSSHRFLIDAVMSRLGLDDFFSATVTGDDVTHYKPNPESLLAAMGSLKSSPEKTLMIGDSSADVFAGKAAGTDTALFLPDIHTRFFCFDTLRGTSPDFTFSHYDELCSFLGLAAP